MIVEGQALLLFHRWHVAPNTVIFWGYRADRVFGGGVAVEAVLNMSLLRYFMQGFMRPVAGCASELTV